MFRLKTVEEGSDVSKTGVSVMNVIGTFEGKSGDGEVTNENGLDISTPVWQAVFDSEEFQYGIEHGYYIGYLGHPDDPGCQDFEHACIILRDASIDENGEVYAKVDLIDTPVGRIVKTFIDAGVEFGLSVRGAGDIIDNSVDPETFCFRGFDLVAFPAYKDAIPTFTEIAASSKLEDVKKYKKICASVHKNIEDVTDVNSLEIIQSQFGVNSKEYKDIQNRINSIKSSQDVTSLYKTKINSTVDLYVRASKENDILKRENKILSSKLKDSQRRLQSTRRIYADQRKEYQGTISKLEQDVKETNQSYKHLENNLVEANKHCDRLVAANTGLKNKLNNAQDDLKAANDNYTKVVNANKKLKDSNLIYESKIQQYEDDLSKKDSVIASLKTKEHETVKASKATEAKISNFDSKISELNDDVKCALSLVKDYQDAYASLYASVIGVSVNNLTIDNTTSVKELKKKISACCSVSDNSSNQDSLDVEVVPPTDEEYNLVTI